MQVTIQYIEKELKPFYPKTEIQALTRLIIEHVSGWDFTEQLLNKNKTIDKDNLQKIVAIINRLKKHEPIQYILGETEFYGLKIHVNPSVLIPRQETEELIQFVLEKNFKQDPVFLDIGTGSGCIALAIKNNLKNAAVHATDNSEEALNVARLNAERNNLDVTFFISDILYWENKKWNSYDLIVSNPPYVRISEKQQMKSNVLDYEPLSALFVPDNDALLFYRRITEFATKYLNKGGLLFFEINENLSEELVDLLSDFRFRQIELRADINGKKRMICSII